MSETVLNSRIVFSGRVIEVRVDQVRLDDGTAAERELVVHQGSVALVAIECCSQDSKRVLLVRQYRHAAGQELWEIPAGRIDTAETAPAAALRELAEEAGLAAKHLEPLMTLYASPGYCTERLHVFVASELSPVQANPDPDERITAAWFDLKEAAAMCLDGRIVDGKTIAALLAVCRLV